MQDGFGNGLNTPIENRRKSKPWLEIGLGFLAVIFLVSVTAVITFCLTVNSLLNSRSQNELANKISVVKGFVDNYGYYEDDDDARIDAALKAYVSSGEDKYGVFYNSEEFYILNASNEGHYVGIGVSVDDAEAVYDGERQILLRIKKVYENSSAAEAGILKGDLIYSFFTEDGECFVGELSEDAALSKLRGKSGSVVKLSVLRRIDDRYEKLIFTLERRSVEIDTLRLEEINEHPEIGLVRVGQFDITTPKLFKEAFETLRAKGITKAVIDLRDNPGGDMKSLLACASYFLKPDDLILSTRDNHGDTIEYYVKERTYSTIYAPCSIAEDEIGMLSDFTVAIVVNRKTASAAELLTAVFRDYGLAPIVGVTTYGKGSVQTIYSLKNYGIDGGLKITTDMYFPPCGESYNGVGITPDIYIEESEGAEDEQLLAAINSILNK